MNILSDIIILLLISSTTNFLYFQTFDQNFLQFNNISQTIQNSDKMDLEWLALIIPLAYFAISTFFLCFPSILHKKKKYSYAPFNQLVDSDKLLCIGHRGGAWQGPENTMETFKKNDHLMHMFELDVCLTKDGKLVVHHDAVLIRTCGSDAYLQDTNYQDLPRFKKHIEAFGSVAVGGLLIETQQNKIPLLEQLFQKYPQKPMNIQLKTPTDAAIQQYSRLVKKFNREQITIWGVAGGKNQNLRQSNQQVVNFYSAGQILKIYGLFLTGLLPFVCLRQGVVDIPLATDSFYKFIKKFTSESCLKSCLGFIIFQILNCFNFLGRIWIRHLKKRGILTFYFIINQEDDFETAIASGCSGIMTDVPTRLNRYLKQRNLFFQQESDSF